MKRERENAENVKEREERGRNEENRKYVLKYKEKYIIFGKGGINIVFWEKNRPLVQHVWKLID